VTVHERAPLGAEEGGRGQVRLHDHSPLVEGEVAGRGEVVELLVASAQIVGLLPGVSQLLVLQLQLDPVGLQLADEG
jgi:hypothetical protein